MSSELLERSVSFSFFTTPSYRGGNESIAKRIPFYGFTTYDSRTREEENVRNLLANLGLPLTNITSVTKSGNPAEVGASATSVAAYVSGSGSLILFNKFFNSDRGYARSALVHEVAHSLSPFQPKESRIYGSREDVMYLQEYVAEVLQQCIRAETPFDIPHSYYTDTYHRSLIDNYKIGNIPLPTLLEETWAIFVQIRYANPAALREIEAQHAAAIGPSYLRLSSSTTKDAEGIDIVLMRLMKTKKLSVVEDTIRSYNTL